jgi:hypothetical protein
MVSAVVLIADYVYSRNMAIVSGIVAGLVFGYFWFLFPVARWRENKAEER